MTRHFGLVITVKYHEFLNPFPAMLTGCKHHHNLFANVHLEGFCRLPSGAPPPCSVAVEMEPGPLTQVAKGSTS